MYFSLRRDARAEAEVNQFGSQLLIKDDILQLDITVCDVLSVQIAQPLGQSLDNNLAVVLGRTMIRLVLQIGAEGNA